LEELRNVSIDLIRVTVTRSPWAGDSSKYVVQSFKADISSTITEPWKPFDVLDGLAFSNIYFLVTYDSSRRPGSDTVDRSKYLDFKSDLMIGKSWFTAVVNVGLETSKDDQSEQSWFFNILEADGTSMGTFGLGDVVEGWASGLDFSLPSEVHDQIQDLLKLDIGSLTLQYSSSRTTSSISFTQRGSKTKILDITVSEICIVCEKATSQGSSWSWTVALAIPSVTKPLASICPLFTVVEISNLNIAFWSAN
jgi:hypothetical protein